MARNEDIFYTYLTGTILPILKADGIWAAPDPSPLTADEVKAVFERIAPLSVYREQELVTSTFDQKVVRMKKGEITIEPIEGTGWQGKPSIFRRDEP